MANLSLLLHNVQNGLEMHPAAQSHSILLPVDMKNEKINLSSVVLLLDSCTLCCTGGKLQVSACPACRKWSRIEI